MSVARASVFVRCGAVTRREACVCECAPAAKEVCHREVFSLFLLDIARRRRGKKEEEVWRVRISRGRSAKQKKKQFRHESKKRENNKIGVVSFLSVLICD